MDTVLLNASRKIAQELTSRKLRLSIAESCTGGSIADAITNIPGASVFFSLAVVSYSVESKLKVLGIRPDIIEQHGVISKETAEAMAHAVRVLGNADIGLATTGVAGPDPSENKPVGLVYVAIETPAGATAREFRLSGSREEIKRLAAEESIIMLDEALRTWA